MIQSPPAVFSDPALRACTVDCSQMGMPKSWTGANAIVFRLRGADGLPLAVRCFTQKVDDVETRYRAYADFYWKAPEALRKGLAEACYLERGIHVQDGTAEPWKPVIVMAWVDGKELGTWVETHLSDRNRLVWLQGKLRDLSAQMTSAGFIHGDLQHRNILVNENGPVLVDYDSVIPPRTKGLTLNTQGLPSFRHPRAASNTQPAMLDRFAFLVLHMALEALIRRPDLFTQWGRGEGLLFQGSDLKNPGASPLFQTLQADPGLKGMAQALVKVCQAAPSETPGLDKFLAMAGGASSASHAPNALPALSALSLDKLNRLYSPKPKSRKPRATAPKPEEPRVNLHRVEVSGPYSSTVQQPVAAATPLAVGLSAVTPMLHSEPAPTRNKAPIIFGGLVMIGLFMFAWRPILSSTRSPAAVAIVSIRGDLQVWSEARKDRLVWLIVGMDDDMEIFRNLPPDLLLAKLDSTNGTVESKTAAQMRHELAQTRAQAQQIFIRCDGVLEDFDAVIHQPGLTPPEQAQRLASIQDLPPDIQSRIRRELLKGATP